MGSVDGDPGAGAGGELVGRRVDCIIVGGGLAGSALAKRLLDLDKSVVLIDRGERDTSSRVAAGLVTPVTGKNLSPSWRLSEVLPVARAFYRSVGKAAGVRLWFDRKTLRLFRSEDEVNDWEGKVEDPGLGPFISQPWMQESSLPPGLKAPLGGFEMCGGGWVDVPAFLDAVAVEIDAADLSSRVTAEVCDDDVALGADPATGEPSATWNGIHSRHLVYCLGHEGARNRFFDWVGFRCAKGEILDLVVDGYGDHRVVSAMGGWLLPVGDGMFRTGSTYAWHALDSTPTKGGRRRIERNLLGFLEPRFAVVGHRAGVRPVINASRVLMGIHPGHPQIGFFNGLGSKGVLYAPFFAEQLARHLTGGSAIDEEVDLRRNS